VRAKREPGRFEGAKGIAAAAFTHKKPRRFGGAHGAQRRAAGLLVTVVSCKTFAEFFVLRMTLAALVAHAFTAFCVLALAVFAMMSFNAFPEFFAVAVALMALAANVLAALLALFPITFLDFRHAALYDPGNRWRLERGRWRRRQCECRQGKG
jgi:hypothetical protein